MAAHMAPLSRQYLWAVLLHCASTLHPCTVPLRSASCTAQVDGFLVTESHLTHAMAAKPLLLTKALRKGLIPAPIASKISVRVVDLDLAARHRPCARDTRGVQTLPTSSLELHMHSNAHSVLPRQARLGFSYELPRHRHAMLPRVRTPPPSLS